MPNDLQQNLRINPALPMQQEGPMPSKVGLSLALCHKLVYLMQGEMHFSSAPQKGCEFWIDIPFYVPNTNLTPQQTTFSCPDKTHALLIETDAHLAKVISLQLATFNIDVSFSKDGSFQEHKDFDLVIIGNTPKFEREANDAILQRQAKACPIFSYHPQAINTSEYPIIALHFPLTQSQLEPLIASVFTNQSRSPKANTHD
jgi:hypothetical protein